MRSVKLLLTAFLIMILVMVYGCFGGGKENDKEADMGSLKKAAAKMEDGEPKEAPPAPAQEAKAEKGVQKAVEEASNVNVSKGKEVLDKVGVAFTYDPVNKPDPFRPYKAQDDLMTGVNVGNPLLKYDVRYFRLVGVFLDENEPRALFEDPTGRSYILHIGERIGRGGGIVQSVARDIVVVTETRISPRFEGGTETVQIPIKLHPEEIAK